MGRVIGILLAVVALWTVAEIYANGSAGAFGGRLAAFGVVEEEAAKAPPPERARAAVERAHAQQQERYESLLPE